MNDSGFSRRRTLRGAGGVASAVLLTGCLDDIPFLGDDGPPPDVGPVPSGSTVFATLGPAAVRRDGPIKDLLDSAIPLNDVDSVFETFQGRYGLDLTDLEQATAFGDPTASGDINTGGLILDGEWSLGDVRTALQEQGYDASETTISGRQGYEFVGSGLTLTNLSDGRVVLGTDGGPAAVLATSAGSRDVLRGAVRRAYGDVPAGPLRFAVDFESIDDSVTETIMDQVGSFSEDVVSGLRFVSGSLYATEGQPGIRVQLEATDQSTGEQLKQFAEALAGLFSQQIADESVLDALEAFDVSRSDTVVTMTLEGSDGAVQPLADYVLTWAMATLLDRASDE